MSKHLLKVFEQLVVDFLQFLKAKSSTISFIIKNIIVFSSLLALFLILNGMLFGFPPISNIAWWEPFANSYGELLGVMRGVWGSILLSPGNLAYHLKIFPFIFLSGQSVYWPRSFFRILLPHDTASSTFQSPFAAYLP